EEVVNVVPEGGTDLPVGVLQSEGGPALGTPEAHAQLRSELLENAGAAVEETKKAKPKPRFRTESREVTVYNFKKTAVRVTVHEALPSQKTQILQLSHQPGEQSNQHATFDVEVPAQGKVTVSYGVKWQIN